MKKLFNVRIPVLLACFLMLGAIAGYLTEFYNVNYVWLAVTALAVAASLVVFLVVKFPKKMGICAILCILLFAVGSISTVIRLNAYDSSPLIDGAKYQITGTVINRTEGEDGVYVTLQNVTAGGNKINGKVYAFIHQTVEENCEVGRKLTFYTEVEKKNAFDYGSFNSDAADNIKYYCRVYYGVSSEQGFYPFGVANSAIRRVLYSNLDYSTASIAAGMLTGGTADMESQTLSIFRYGGIAHIFAVSGLHIGVIFSVLTFIFKRLKCNKYVSTAISITAVLLYAGVCGFSASSLRAVIMCAVFSISKLVYGKYDGLNSLAISAIIILLINPLRLFTIGFQLSFGAVASIFILSPTFNRVFKALPQTINSSLSTALSVQAGTLPISLNGFGYLSVASIFLNVIAIPVMSLLYVLLLFCTLLSLIIPPAASFLLAFSATPLQFITSLFISAGFENAIIRAGGISFLTPLWYIMLLAMSHKFNLSSKVRAAICSACAGLIAVLCCISAFTPFTGVTVYVTASYNGEGVIFKNGSKSVLVITEGSSQSFVISAQNDYCFKPFDAIIILGGDDEFFQTVLNVSDVAQQIYLSPDNYNVAVAGEPNIYYEQAFTLCGVEFNFLNEYTVTAQAEGVKTAICAGEEDKYAVDLYCDLLVSTQPRELSYGIYTVYFSLKNYKYNICDYGDLIFSLKNGRIERKGIIPIRDCLY